MRPSRVGESTAATGVGSPRSTGGVGSTLGAWRLERLLGVGGTAAVYAARRRGQDDVALKVLHGDVASPSQARKRLEWERRATARVGHPGVVAMHGNDVDTGGRAFLVMELLQGETVGDVALRRGGTLPAVDVLDVAARTLTVLSAAHERGVLHRDIKPQNLFLTRDGVLKVLDFGAATIDSPELPDVEPSDFPTCGTPAFSPPEQARGCFDEIDERSDVWAVGATMFTLLTGRYVHAVDVPSEMLGVAMTAAAPSLGAVEPSIPAEVVRVVDRALSYERRDRWQSARAMHDAVQGAQSDVRPRAGS